MCSLAVEEFECTDCGVPVVRLGGRSDQPRRCAGCQFLTWIEDPAERAATREHLLKTNVIGP